MVVIALEAGTCWAAFTVPSLILTRPAELGEMGQCRLAMWEGDFVGLVYEFCTCVSVTMYPCSLRLVAHQLSPLSET